MWHRHLPSNHSVDDMNLDKENINKHKEYYNDLPGKSPPIEEIQVRFYCLPSPQIYLNLY